MSESHRKRRGLSCSRRVGYCIVYFYGQMDVKLEPKSVVGGPTDLNSQKERVDGQVIMGKLILELRPKNLVGIKFSEKE